MDEKSRLEELNDDCLEHMFGFLEFEDVIRLTPVSHRFRAIGQRWMSRWMTKHDIPEFSELVSLRDAKPRDFFAIFGNYIKHIRILISNEHVSKHFHLLPEYCDNVICIDLECRANGIGLLSFLGRMQSVRRLDIRGDFQNTNVVEEIIKLQDLECLHIYRSSITGHRLNELKNLTELDLSCENVTTEHFIDAFLANRNLTKINISGCPNIGPEAYRCMAKESRSLESLTFNTNFLLNGELISGLNHLKNLKIECVYDSEFGELLLREYSNTLGKTLTRLTLYQWETLPFSQTMLFPNVTELNVFFWEWIIPDLDIGLRRLSNIFPHLNKVAVRCDYSTNVNVNVVVDIFRHLKSLVYANFEIRDFFSVDKYKEIVAIRKRFSRPVTLKLRIWEYSEFYEEIVEFTKGAEYAAFSKFVEIVF